VSGSRYGDIASSVTELVIEGSDLRDSTQVQLQLFIYDGPIQNNQNWDDLISDSDPLPSQVNDTASTSSVIYATIDVSSKKGQHILAVVTAFGLTSSAQFVGTVVEGPHSSQLPCYLQSHQSFAFNRTPNESIQW